MKDLPVELLHELLDLDPVTGLLTWKARGEHHFRAPGYADRWNKRFAGTPALNYVGKWGYRGGSILGRCVKAHRVVFAMQNGAWPKGEVDHEEGQRATNAPAQLRDATRLQNGKNQKLRVTNTSGTPGVDHRHGKWRARIKVNHQHMHLGTFATKEEAVAARKAAETLHGFHPNHGRAAA